MDFSITDTQRELGESVASWCRRELPIDSISSERDDCGAISKDTWEALGKTGVFSMLLPESQGGAGLGLGDASVVFEELGRALVPGPLVATALAAGLVKGAEQGNTIVGAWCSCRRATDHVTSVYVEHFASLDALLALSNESASNETTAALVDLSTLTSSEPLTSLDPLTPISKICGPMPPGVDVEIHVPRAFQHPPISPGSALWIEGSILTASLQVGIAAACLDLAVAHAKSRHQFGRQIGSFQSIKHLCAEMLTRSEIARCAVEHAGTLYDQLDALEAEARAVQSNPASMLTRAVSGAKLLADGAADFCARTAIQVHGGMGFTWEMPLHLYLKRTRVLSTSFGTAAELSLKVADRL